MSASSSPTLDILQKDIDQWIHTVGVRYFNELTNLGILCEEMGELARIIVREYGDQSFKKTDKKYNLADEMADILFTLICLANQTGVNLSEAIENNMHKKNKRDKKRHANNIKLIKK